MRCSSELRLMLIATCGAALICAGTAAEAPARPTFHASIVAASEAAAADKSLVLVTLGGDWCPPCRLMRKTVLNSDEFLDVAGALRIAEIDVQANPKAATDFDASSFPTLVLMTADGKIVARDVGAKDTPQLLAWLESGRERARRGLWEGTAPGAAMTELISRAAANRINEQDLRKLVTMLGGREPGERVAASKIIAGQRETAVPILLEALGDDYLGVRIGVSDLLRKMAPGSPTIDPWQAPGDLTNSIAAVRHWWSQTGKLNANVDVASLDPSLKTSIITAIESLRGNDAARRTEGMSALVASGPAALPSVRDAIKRYEKSGDLRMVGLLEDVRWAILVPDTVEQRVNVRGALARGAGPERQAATIRLGKAGRPALDALGELAGDGDPLVVESAVRSLSAIGGKDAIPAMAALLKANDANLRMTAAQALGRSKSPDATAHLVAVLNDPNEVVACTALAAIEQIYSRGENLGFGYSTSPSADSTTPEVTTGLKQALKDPRWRVRATAVEIAGKLRETSLANELRACVEDTDGFVVKNALTALHALGSAPNPEQLVAVAKRLPAIRGEAVRALARSSSENAAKLAGDLFDQSDDDARAAILTSLGQRDRYDNSRLDESWQSMIGKGVASTNDLVRRAAAGLLTIVTAKVASELVAPLLGDAHPEVRVQAAQSVLELLSGKRSKSVDSETTFFNLEDSTPDNDYDKANPVISAATRTEWHKTLAAAGATNHALSAAAWFVTGDNGADVLPLAHALNRADLATAKRFALSPALDLIVPKLRWPESEALLQSLVRSPALFAAAAAESQSTNAVRDFLLEPARFTAALEPAQGETLEFALGLLMNRRKGSWTLLDPSAATHALTVRLAESTNAAWRAAALFALGKASSTEAAPLATKAVRDPNPWVRAAGIQVLGRGLKERAELELQVGPFLADTNEAVAAMAASLLLEPELRSASGAGWRAEIFQFEKIRAGMDTSFGGTEERPLVALETRPPYLAEALSWLQRDVKDHSTFALLLAQHGDASGIDALAGRKDPESSAALLAAISLTRDNKYLPVLRGLLDEAKESYEFQRILRALKGMSGPEVRQLRLEINKRMRLTSN